MKFTLNTKIIKPDDKNEINNAIILFHGYGGNGEDISMLTLNWKRFLPNTVFLCPDGHEACEINANGFQWFDLSKDEPEYILEQSLIAEKIVNRYIDEVKDVYKLKKSQIYFQRCVFQRMRPAKGPHGLGFHFSGGHRCARSQPSSTQRHGGRTLIVE